MYYTTTHQQCLNMKIEDIVKRTIAYSHPPTPQSNITNSFITQRSSDFDIPHDTRLISISSHERGEKEKENKGYAIETTKRGIPYQPHKNINNYVTKSLAYII